VRDHGFHRVRVVDVVRETAEAGSLVLDVPDGFGYHAGQFVTVRVEAEGREHLRCYSMSSAPAVDDRFQVTVKRVPGGIVSNWLLDHLAVGDELEVTAPAGVFCLPPGDGDVIGFAAGSGITPVHSILKSALAAGRRVRLLYANRDRASTIFAAELDELVRAHVDRLEVHHHLDVESGFVDAAAVRAFIGDATAGDVFVCGPTPFMDVVEAALLDAGVPAERIHIERFTPAAPLDPADAGAAAPTGGAGPPTTITIELDGRTATTEHRPGTTVLQAARQAGLAPPFSCEAGSCATCMAKLEEGTCSMFVNNALTDDEVAEGWILTCQSVPTSPAVHVVYEGA
jgi:3-ketosteroid 9alpha-monooxygenase subunit B